MQIHILQAQKRYLTKQLRCNVTIQVTKAMTMYTINPYVRFGIRTPSMIRVYDKQDHYRDLLENEIFTLENIYNVTVFSKDKMIWSEVTIRWNYNRISGENNIVSIPSIKTFYNNEKRGVTLLKNLCYLVNN